MKKNYNSHIPHQLALFAITTLVFGLYIFLAARNHFSSIDPLVHGTASRPYVYRVLTFALVGAVSRASGISLFGSAMVIMYLSLLGFVWFMQKLAGDFLPAGYLKPVAFLAPIGLIPFLIEQRHVYDFPTLFIFTLSLHLLARNDFKKYFVAFVAAALIKETALFLTLFFILQFGKIGTKKFIFLVFAQLLVYAVIRTGIMLAFKDNPGTVMEYHLYDHAAAYRQRQIAATGLLCTIIAVGAGAAYLRKRHPFISNSLIAIGGTTTVLYLFFGVPFEIRVFLETYPSIFLTVVLSAVSYLVQFKHREIIRQVSR